ncbi:hypothetical protein QQF64_000070 [Cirrhinus molitorella]|uniref:Uncharacterized protein n=1 Tax=Cirrhinus molitorella TaxID=172907 RepID=A0ABR3NW49_9TELE
MFVEAQDYSGDNLNVKITVKNHPKKNLDIVSESVTLTAASNFQTLTDIKIPSDRDYFSDDPLEKQYVYLQAQFPSVTLEKVDPQGITTMRETIFPEQGIRSGKYAVPQPARYLHGNNVNGHAFVVFGVMEDERKTSIPSSLQRVRISDGQGNSKLTKEKILQTFPDINQLVGRSFYISVSVLTDTGSVMVEAQRKGIQIVTSPYTIHFQKTPQFFKPGMPFDVSLKVQVKEPPPIYEPGEGFSLQITGDTGAKVGLVAVDKAVHGLNQNRLTQTKIWYIIQKHDIGCTAGGGRDSMGVFTDAGLMFESNSAGGTNARTSMFVLSYY